MTAAAKKVVRIVSCLSPHGLLAAMAALRQMESVLSHESGTIFEDYLVVHSLPSISLDDPKEQDFFLVIKKIALAVNNWQNIVLLSNTLFSRAVEADYHCDLLRLLREQAGVEKADEIYLPKNRDFFSSRLMQAFNSAKKICYGDGFSIYHDIDVVTHGYYRNSIWDSFSSWHWWRSIILSLYWLYMIRNDQRRFKELYLSFPKMIEAHLTPYERQQFDFGCYLFPDGLGLGSGEVLKKYFISPVIVRDILINAAGQMFDEGSLSALKQKVIGKNVVVLMPVTFSNSHEIGIKNELLAYRDSLKKIAHRDSLILVKVHPMDRQDRLNLLKTILETDFNEVVLLSGPQYCYTPFEILYESLFRQYVAQDACQVKLIAFRTSNLSVAKIYGLGSEIGFGFWLVLKYFNVRGIIYRLWEERANKKAMQAALKK